MSIESWRKRLKLESVEAELLLRRLHFEELDQLGRRNDRR